MRVAVRYRRHISRMQGNSVTARQLHPASALKHRVTNNEVLRARLEHPRQIGTLRDFHAPWLVAFRIEEYRAFKTDRMKHIRKRVHLEPFHAKTEFWS
jgi:hypothetical protein